MFRLSLPIHRLLLFAVTVGVCLAAAGGAAADVLITLDGQRIDTQGPWRIDGAVVVWEAEDGRRSLPLEDIDLEASREMTAAGRGEEYTPLAEAETLPRVAEVADRGADGDTRFDTTDRPPIILYETNWCGYCRKARRLLKQLDAEYVAKDVEKDRVAAHEAFTKSGTRGVPVLDFGGVVVRGFNDRSIRKLVRSMREQGHLEPESR